MKIESVFCRNFRNLEEIAFFPDEQMNVIYGENAQGKTNLLEALWLFTGAKSFRGVKDREMVAFSAEKAKISMDFSCEGVSKNAEIQIEKRRTAFLNGNRLKSAAELAGFFRAIIFSPQDLYLVEAGPEKRRRFLDIAISQLFPAYLQFLKRYVRAMAQRNRALKEIKAGLCSVDILDAFEEEMARCGLSIIRYRSRYTEYLSEYTAGLYDGISSSKEKLAISYQPVCEANLLREALKNSRKEDFYTLSTGVGPHRDDLLFCINGNTAKTFASQGQKRSIALSLKLSEAGILEKITGEQPVSLLDDVMSELDPGRQDFILNHIRDRQVFITCCDPNQTEILQKGKRVKMEEGRIEKECIST